MVRYIDPQTNKRLKKPQIVDGRNRAAAIIDVLGWNIYAAKGNLRTDLFQHFDHTLSNGLQSPADDKPFPPNSFAFEDPYAYVVTANIRRRHSSPKELRDQIAKLLKANPGRSNRSIAREIGTSHHKVQKVRTQAESTGQISQLEATTGDDGKTRKTKRAMKPAPASKPEAPNNEQPKPVEQPKPEIIAYGVTLWPNSVHEPFTYDELCHAIWYSRFIEGQLRDELTPRDRRQQMLQAGLYIVPMLKGPGWYCALCAIYNAFASHPEAACKFPPQPTNFSSKTWNAFEKAAAEKAECPSA